MKPLADELESRSSASVVLLLLLALLFAGFVALGSWQVQRRAWKLELIERVEQRLRAPPLAAPGRAQWPAIGDADQYTRLRVQGRYLSGHDALVQAVTVRGAGFWVLTPLQTDDGVVVLINRGFIAADAVAAFRAAQAAGASTDAGEAGSSTVVTGLLRVTEPGGGFLRRNDAVAQRWYSRDVAAIAAALQLPPAEVAPYFIDADAALGGAADAGSTPAGGLTVVSFHNSHLVYAITWYTLALMCVGAAVLVLRQRRGGRAA